MKYGGQPFTPISGRARDVLRGAAPYVTSRDAAAVAALRAALEPALAALVAPVQAVYLHGSWSTGWSREESDVDLAILAGRPLGLEERLSIFREVYAVTGGGKAIDIAELLRADCVFASRVIMEGERILVYDKNAADRFEMITLAKYARLNEERAGIVADIRQRGTIYLAETNA